MTQTDARKRVNSKVPIPTKVGGPTKRRNVIGQKSAEKKILATSDHFGPSLAPRATTSLPAKKLWTLEFVRLWPLFVCNFIQKNQKNPKNQKNMDSSLENPGTN